MAKALTLEEEKMLEGCIERNDEALELFAEYITSLDPYVKRTIRSLGANFESTDIINDFFLIVREKPESKLQNILKNKNPLEPFLKACLKNKILDILKKNREDPVENMNEFTARATPEEYENKCLIRLTRDIEGIIKTKELRKPPKRFCALLLYFRIGLINRFTRAMELTDTIHGPLNKINFIEENIPIPSDVLDMKFTDETPTLGETWEQIKELLKPDENIYIDFDMVAELLKIKRGTWDKWTSLARKGLKEKIDHEEAVWLIDFVKRTKDIGGKNR